MIVFEVAGDTDPTGIGHGRTQCANFYFSVDPKGHCTIAHQPYRVKSRLLVSLVLWDIGTSVLQERVGFQQQHGWCRRTSGNELPSRRTGRVEN